MRIEYSKRATADLLRIAEYHGTNAIDPNVAGRFADSIEATVARIAEWPEVGRRVAERPGVRVVPLFRYRYVIFYQIIGDAIRILHIRHTSRRPWTRR